MQLQLIQNKIYEIRGQRVMLDFDLAEPYEIETRVLKQAVKRNLNRFPKNFMFELTKKEYNEIRTQFIIDEHGRGKYSKFNPFAFTEKGVAMLASVLNSSKAIEINIQIVRACDTSPICLRLYQTKQQTRNLYDRNQYAVYRYLSSLNIDGK